MEAWVRGLGGYMDRWVHEGWMCEWVIITELIPHVPVLNHNLEPVFIYLVF